MHATVRIDRHRVAPLPARSRDDDPERKPKPAEEDRRQDVGDVILLSSRPLLGNSALSRHTRNVTLVRASVPVIEARTGEVI